MKKTIFEEMGGTYVRCGDYFIPNLTLPEEEEPRFVGVWGQRHLQYLKEYRRNVYLDLMMSGRLNSYLADIEEQAQEERESESNCRCWKSKPNLVRRSLLVERSELMISRTEKKKASSKRGSHIPYCMYSSKIIISRYVCLFK